MTQTILQIIEENQPITMSEIIQKSPKFIKATQRRVKYLMDKKKVKRVPNLMNIRSPKYVINEDGY